VKTKTKDMAGRDSVLPSKARSATAETLAKADEPSNLDNHASTEPRSAVESHPAITNLSPVSLAKAEASAEAEDWQQFCVLDTQSKVFGVKASAALILSGAELERLHAKYAILRGGDQTRTRAGLLWTDMLEQYGRISEDTAMRRRKLALAAAEHLPVLQEVLAGEADPRLLCPTKKLALEKGLQALTAGKTQRQLMWDFGLGPMPRKPGRFRPNAQMVQKWLAQHHPRWQGASYADLPPQVRKAFKKQSRPPGFTLEQEAEMKRDWWRTHALGLSEQLQKKTYHGLDARDRQWIAMAYYEGWKALSVPAVLPAAL
jgi:hypothetical protein